MFWLYLILGIWFGSGLIAFIVANTIYYQKNNRKFSYFLFVLGVVSLLIILVMLWDDYLISLWRRVRGNPWDRKRGT